MSDGEEKTFPATAKKRAEARKQGQVARSPEFGAATSLLALVVALHAALPGAAGQSLLADLRAAFAFHPGHTIFDDTGARGWQLQTLVWTGRLILPVMLLALVLGVGAGIGQVGFALTPEALAPKWERLNPASGVKRLLSRRGLVELGKGLLKMALVGGICLAVVRPAVENGDLLATMRMPLGTMLETVGHLLWTLGLRVGAALLILAVADFAYQKWEFEKNLKMSASEIKQEMKQSEGDPQVKGRIRRLQREMSRRRMMQDVPKADVVITNPTHFAIALQYEAGASAPKVVAKGQDELARRIKDLARESRVPLVENKPLAQTLYRAVDIGDPIPGELYEAVAQVLAFVYRTHGRQRT